MAKKKSKGMSMAGLLVFGLAIVGFVGAIVSMFLDVVSGKSKVGSGSIGEGLFSDFVKNLSDPSSTFMIISFVVALVGLLIIVASLTLTLLKMNIKLLTVIGSLVAIVGGVLIIVSGYVYNGALNDNLILGAGVTYSPGIGIWLGCISSIVGSACGLISTTNIVK